MRERIAFGHRTFSKPSDEQPHVVSHAAILHEFLAKRVSERHNRAVRRQTIGHDEPFTFFEIDVSATYGLAPFDRVPVERVAALKILSEEARLAEARGG
jgi:hypothetical protein